MLFFQSKPRRQNELLEDRSPLQLNSETSLQLLFLNQIRKEMADPSDTEKGLSIPQPDDLDNLRNTLMLSLSNLRSDVPRSIVGRIRIGSLERNLGVAIRGLFLTIKWNISTSVLPFDEAWYPRYESKAESELFTVKFSIADWSRSSQVLTPLLYLQSLGISNPLEIGSPPSMHGVAMRYPLGLTKAFGTNSIKPSDINPTCPLAQAQGNGSKNTFRIFIYRASESTVKESVLLGESASPPFDGMRNEKTNALSLPSRAKWILAALLFPFFSIPANNASSTIEIASESFTRTDYSISILLNPIVLAVGIGATSGQRVGPLAPPLLEFNNKLRSPTSVTLSLLCLSLLEVWKQYYLDLVLKTRKKKLQRIQLEVNQRNQKEIALKKAASMIKSVLRQVFRRYQAYRAGITLSDSKTPTSKEARTRKIDENQLSRLKERSESKRATSGSGVDASKGIGRFRLFTCHLSKRREGNRCADFFARMGSSQLEQFMPLEYPSRLLVSPSRDSWSKRLAAAPAKLRKQPLPSSIPSLTAPFLFAGAKLKAMVGSGQRDIRRVLLCYQWAQPKRRRDKHHLLKRKHQPIILNTRHPSFDFCGYQPPSSYESEYRYYTLFRQEDQKTEELGFRKGE
ncbi:DNA glycosylase superfamily protein [Striga asiatica]|uniref:DNA glycosylase superfamily protein n=1 Tax=Striga asiatica TaxID=4170 RepID=A0A5A7QL58_STRAF|nr:DNA glycosylase superfamily protein [Striga asiatica]